MPNTIALRPDFTASALRGLARRSRDAAQARRLLSLAVIYDGGTHSSGRIGSPIVAGSTRRRKSFKTVGSALLKSGRPAPLRRTRTVDEDAAKRSRALRMIVLRATPVARDTAAVPP